MPQRYRSKGNLLFLSGVGPRLLLRDAKAATTVDFAEQCEDVFAIVNGILDEASSSWAELLDITVFLTDIAADLETFEEVWAEYFPDPATEPCCTVVQVGALPFPGAISIKCIASVKV